MFKIKITTQFYKFKLDILVNNLVYTNKKGLTYD